MRVDGSSLGFCCVTYPRWSVNCSTRKRKYYELWRRWGSLYSFLLKKDYKTAILFKNVSTSCTHDFRSANHGNWFLVNISLHLLATAVPYRKGRCHIILVRLRVTNYTSYQIIIEGQFLKERIKLGAHYRE